MAELDWSKIFEKRLEPKVEERPKLDWSKVFEKPEPVIRAPLPTDYTPQRLPYLAELQVVEPYAGLYKFLPTPLRALALSFSRSFSRTYREFGKMVVPEELKAQEEFLAREHPTLTKIGEVAGSIGLYTAGVATGAPLPIVFGGIGGMMEAARLKNVPDLTPTQKASRIGIASGAGALTGKIFQMASLQKTTLGRILTRSGGTGATTVAENITKEFVTERKPDVLNALVEGGTQAVVIGVLGAFAEIPALRHSIFREAKLLSARKGSPPPKTYAEAVNIVKQAGITPEKLSPHFQHAVYEAKKRAVLKDINIYAQKHGINRKLAEEIIAEKNVMVRLSKVDDWLYHMKRINPAKAEALAPFRKQIAQGADPVDILIAMEMNSMAKAAPPITKVITKPEIKTYDIPRMEFTSEMTGRVVTVPSTQIKINPDLWHDVNYAVGGALRRTSMRGIDIIRFHETGVNDKGEPFRLVDASPMKGEPEMVTPPPVVGPPASEYEEIQRAVMAYSGLAPKEESASPVEPPPNVPPTTEDSPAALPPEETPGTTELMEPGGLKALFTRIFKVIDVERPWKAIGTPETGFHIKNYFSQVGAHEDFAYTTVRHLTRTTKLTPSEYAELTFYVAQPPLFERLSKEKATVMSEACHQVTKYFKRYEDILKKEEIIVDPWPQSQIHRLQEEIGHIRETMERVQATKMKDTLKEERLAKLREEIAEMQTAVDFLKKENIQYVHIPVRLWLEDLFNKNPIQARRIVNRFFRVRETVDIRELAENLIQEGIITKEDVDVRNIIASYGSTVGRKIALSRIINAAKAEGLVRSGEEKPEWNYFQRKLAPELKGMRVHPAFAEWLEEFTRMPHPRRLCRLFAYTKIMAFTNPIMLPLYDLYQAFWLGSTRSIRTPISVWRAIKSMALKDKHYYNAFEQGGFSQPFTPSFDDFRRNIEMAKSYDSFLHYTITFLQQNLKIPTDLIYKPLWHIAWGGDRLVRLISYHHLKGMGASDREAGQLTAFFHSDYASVPAKTRNKLNYVFFTPIFPITMAKLQTQMITSIGKVLAGAARARKPAARNSMLAAGLLMLLGLTVMRDTIMRILGYKRDVFGYRYSKEVIDAEGNVRELVVVSPAPDNVVLRYLHGFPFAAHTPERMARLINRLSWRLHPIWRTVVCISTNKREDGRTPIYHPYSSRFDICRDILSFAFTNIVAITRKLDELPAATGERRMAIDALKEDVGLLNSLLIRGTSHIYLREVKDIRTRARMIDLIDEFEEFTAKKPLAEEKLEEAYRRFERALGALTEVEE